jgi:hypothetical protein
LVRAVMTATEAKAALLQELSVPSRQSPSVATGTGTDHHDIAFQLQIAGLRTGIDVLPAGIEGMANKIERALRHE